MNYVKNLTEKGDPIFDSVHSQQISITHSHESRNPEQQSVFHTPTPPAKANARKILATQIKSVGVDPNANLKALTAIFFKMIFQRKKNCQLLNSLKYTLRKKQVNLASIKNKPQRGIENIQMKKILNDFFQIMKAKSQGHTQQNQTDYSHHVKQQAGLVVQTISHHPIILEIMTLFLRALLLSHNPVKNSDNYELSVPTEQAYYIICQIFDVNCRLFGQFFQFIEDGLFICSHDNNEYVFGNFYINEAQLRKSQPDLSKSTLRYLQDRSKGQESKRSLPLQQSLHSNISKSSDSGGFGNFFRSQTPFFKGDDETPCFGKQKNESGPFNFQRYRQSNVSQISQNQENRGTAQSEKIRKISTNSKDSKISGRIQKVFGIVSIIESQEEFSRSNNKQSEVLHCQIQSPIDALQSNPISPTTWSFFTNKLKQFKVVQQQNIVMTNRTSNHYKDSLCLPRTLNELERKSSKSKENKEIDPSASHSNNPATPQSDYRKQFFSSRLDEYQIKRVQTEEQDKQDQKCLLQASKTHKSAYNFKYVKDLSAHQKNIAKSLSGSGNKDSGYFLHNFPHYNKNKQLFYTKSKKKLEIINCGCRQIKRERIQLKSNTFSVQIRPNEPEFKNPSFYDYFIPNSNNLSSGKNSPKQIVNNNLISSPSSFKKKNQVVTIPTNVPHIIQTHTIASILTNRKSQCANLQGSIKQKHQTQKDSKELNIFTSKKDEQKQPTNQFFKIFGKRKGKNGKMLHSSTQLQGHLQNAEQIGHYSSNSNIGYNIDQFHKRKSDYQENKYFKHERAKNSSMRGQKPIGQKHTPIYCKWKPNVVSLTGNENKMKFLETRGFVMTETNDRILTRPCVSLGNKQRKLSYNIVSPRKRANQQLFNSQTINDQLYKNSIYNSDRERNSNFQVPRPKAYILNNN